MRCCLACSDQLHCCRSDTHRCAGQLLRMKKASCSTLDMLSNLPENILDKILSCLSMKDVVRTSVLSTKWRYKWLSVPLLNFNDGCVPVSAGSLGHDKLVRIVNHVLLLHRGPIEGFKISSSHLQTCSDIDSWILYLSLNSVEKFNLQLRKSVPYTVPPCLFSFRQLIHLTLFGCIIIQPMTFKGFGCLKTLAFQKVTLSNATLECIVSTCPQLETLTLIDIDGPTHIELSNPKLRGLFISGKFIDICLKDLRSLVSAYFEQANEPCLGQRRTCNFTNFFGSLLGIKKLALKGWFLQSFTMSDVPWRLPYTYDHLRSFSCSLNVEDVKSIMGVICLLRSSPNLEEIEIVHCHNRKAAIVPDKRLQKTNVHLGTFYKLRVVNVSQYFDTNIEREFVKAILANSPVLETMKISLAINLGEVLKLPYGLLRIFSLLIQLLSFRRASPQAEIVFGASPQT